jgi:hypothetical protein
MVWRVREGTAAGIWRVYLARQGTSGEPATGLRPGPGARGAFLRETDAAPTGFDLRPGLIGEPAPARLTEIDPLAMPGAYEFVPPPDAFAPGARSVIVCLRLPGARAWHRRVEVVAFDPRAGADLGLGGFARSTRHEHLTGIFRRVMPEPVERLSRALRP